MKRIIPVICVAAAGAFAADKEISGHLLTEEEAESYPYTHLLLLTGRASQVPYSVDVTLDPGGCIVGPFRMADNAGNEIFSLVAGADFPVGCAKNQIRRWRLNNHEQ